MSLPQHLTDIASCVSLARPLMIQCCGKLSQLLSLDEKLQRVYQHSHAVASVTNNTASSSANASASAGASSSSVKGGPSSSKHLHDHDALMEEEEDDKDSVFNEPLISGSGTKVRYSTVYLRTCTCMYVLECMPTKVKECFVGLTV